MHNLDCGEIEKLEAAIKQARELPEKLDLKDNSSLLHGILDGAAEQNKYYLKLRSSILSELAAVLL